MLRPAPSGPRASLIFLIGCYTEVRRTQDEPNKCKQKLMFTVFSFGHITKVFGLLYSVMLQGLFWSSFFGHVNNPHYASELSENVKKQKCEKTKMRKDKF